MLLFELVFFVNNFVENFYFPISHQKAFDTGWRILAEFSNRNTFLFLKGNTYDFSCSGCFVEHAGPNGYPRW